MKRKSIIILSIILGTLIISKANTSIAFEFNKMEQGNSISFATLATGVRG